MTRSLRRVQGILRHVQVTRLSLTMHQVSGHRPLVAGPDQCYSALTDLLGLGLAVSFVVFGAVDLSGTTFPLCGSVLNDHRLFLIDQLDIFPGHLA